jgi:uncharacterized protein YaiL (DUF2058 family)
MTISLRDQLLGLGFKTAPKPERKPEHKPGHKATGKPAQGESRRGGKPVQADNRPRNPPPHKAAARRTDARPSQQKPRTREDIDLAKAYAIRAQREKDERIEAERLKQEEARKRREAKATLATLLIGKALNAADAEHVRHFEYGGKIKRIHVTAEQLKALNAGELGVLQQDGRYLLVTAALLAEAEAIFAPAVALKVDPNAPAEADPYADPQYQVPDDLVW